MKREALAVSPFLRREGGRGVRSVAGPTPLTLLAGLLALAFVLRWGGVSYPQFRSSDLVFHAHNLTYVLDVLHGAGRPFFFPGKLPNGTLVPYPSAYYVLLTPFAAVSGGTNEAAISLLLVASALLDSLVVLPVWALARRWGARAGLAAAALYALGPAPFQLFSAGNHTNLFAGATLVATLAAAAAALEQAAGPARRRWLAAFGAGSLLTLLGHYGVALSLLGVIGSVAVVWLVAAPRSLRSRIGPLLAVFALTVVLAYGLYYVHFNAEMIAQVRSLVQRTAPPGARFTPSALLADLVRWQGGAAGIALLGLIGWLGGHAGVWTAADAPGWRSPAGLVLIGWLLACIPLAASALFDRDTIRYNLLILPPLCMGAGIALAGWARQFAPRVVAGRRIQPGVLLAGALGGLTALYTLAVWTTSVLRQYHP
ncbi:MAG: hypothetical protein M3Z04_21535 [Chloroflexota bacterium]|nr:hypothetical protein [Chloroflexota bacterium]